MEPPHSSLLSADISRRNRWAARPRRVFLAILLAYLVLAVGYSVAVPLGEAPDEADHYAYIVYLGVHRALPQGSEVTQSKHPPLYHAAAAALTAWTGLDFTFLRSNPDALPLGPASRPISSSTPRWRAFPGAAARWRCIWRGYCRWRWAR
jgi:hypothetical protein